MLLTGSEIIAECLLEQGVDTIFGFPGGAVLNIYDTLYLQKDKFTHIMTAHEQGAAHSADGYARSTGKTGVVIATSGPGATNLITGLATAYMDSSPVVAITGNVSRDLLGKDSFQEVDIKEISKPITKASFQVNSMEKLAPTIRKAFEIANSGRKGPVLVDVPKDITALKAEYTPIVIDKSHKEDTFKTQTLQNIELHKHQIEHTLELISKSQRPLIYAGGGIISGDASKQLTAFAQKLNAPVCCSIMGLGGISCDNPLFIGNIGMHGIFHTGKATRNADLIIALGARFSDRVAGDTSKFRENCNIIHIDIDKKEINKNVLTNSYVTANVKETLEELTEKMQQKDHSQWLSQIDEWRSDIPSQKENKENIPTPEHIIKTINSYKKPEDIIVTDVGQHQMWVSQLGEFKKPRTFLTSGGLGTMGFGVGAAIGAKYGQPDSRVTLVTGDGSFHMNLNELVTLKSYNIPIVVVVMNNTVLGMVRQWQKVFYGNRFSETDPHRQTNFEKMSEAFGVCGMTVTKQDEFKDALEKAYSLNAPVVIDCQISPDANVLPMIPPGKTADDTIIELW